MGEVGEGLVVDVGIDGDSKGGANEGGGISNRVLVRFTIFWDFFGDVKFPNVQLFPKVLGSLI